MVKKHTALIMSIFAAMFLSGCSAKYFGVGDDEFKCKGGSDDGVCAGVEAVYKNRYLIDGMTRIDKKQKEQKSEDLNITVDPIAEEYPDVPKPVRVGEQIQRIYLDPYSDKSNNYITGHFVFKVVKEGRWLLPDGRFLSEEKR